MAKRPLAWADTIISNALAVGSGISPTLLANTPASDTIIIARLVIHLNVIPDAELSVIDGVMGVDIGIGVATVQAHAAGALPDPSVDAEAPARGWLWVDRMTIYTAVGAGPIDRWFFPEVYADIRTMRKVDKGVLYIRAKNVNVSGGSFAV